MTFLINGLFDSINSYKTHVRRKNQIVTGRSSIYKICWFIYHLTVACRCFNIINLKTCYIIFIGIRKIAPKKWPPRKLPPLKLPHRKLPPRKLHPMKITPMNISPYEWFPLWKSPPRIFSPRKLPPGKITPNKISSPLINHTNERKNKIKKFFALKKAVQYNILIKITNILFDTQMVSQKILGLDTFFAEWKKFKNWTKEQITKWHLLASCTFTYKSRRTETRQSNYKIWQIGGTTK